MAVDKKANAGSNSKLPHKTPAGFSPSKPHVRPISKSQFSKNKTP